ncbi:uncharacterized protein LOC123646341 [Lemur catta]|uniref:uncharacterized protein LOC123646341 n=1 Tax=Lemur catta TaxID=9447 RepID=UPI001E26DE65|nr:uncharacterized protein LOC123646341 [Lemur catta]
MTEKISGEKRCPCAPGCPLSRWVAPAPSKPLRLRVPPAPSETQDPPPVGGHRADVIAGQRLTLFPSQFPWGQRSRWASVKASTLPAQPPPGCRHTLRAGRRRQGLGQPPKVLIFGDAPGARAVAGGPGPAAGLAGQNRWAQRGDHVRTEGEDTVCKPRKEASGRTSPADTLTLDFQPPGLLSELPSLWGCVLALQLWAQLSLHPLTGPFEASSGLQSPPRAGVCSSHPSCSGLVSAWLLLNPTPHPAKTSASEQATIRLT